MPFSAAKKTQRRKRLHLRAGGADDASETTMDVSSMDPGEAVAKLAAQNQALAAHVRKLKHVLEDNSDLKEQLNQCRAELDARTASQQALNDKLKCTAPLPAPWCTAL